MLYRIEPDQPNGYLERQNAVNLAQLGHKEADLQKWLLGHLDQVIRTDELLPLTESRRGQEIPDILAVDRNGTLFIFELKRWESESSNLLQVMRYAQIASKWRYEDLNAFHQETRPNETPLSEYHADMFGSKIPNEKWNHDQQLVVITNGLDSDTRQAIQYWRRKGVTIRPWIYRIYELENAPYIDINAFGEADDPFEDRPAKFHLVNTNANNAQVSHDYMLEKNRASAFYGNWKHKIDNIERGDWVFLYESGNGVVALGRCDSGKPGVKEPPHGEGDKNEEHYVDLNPFHLLERPLPANELRELAGYHIPLVSTYTSIRPEAGDTLVNTLTGRTT